MVCADVDRSGFFFSFTQETLTQGTPIQATFQSNGLQLRYSVLGHGSPVLLLAGGPGLDAGYMMPLASIVAREHTAIVLDQRGTDGSMPKLVNAQTVNMDLYLADYEALRRKLGYARWAVLGHSFGSYFAMTYATRYPDAVSRMVLTGTMPPTGEMVSHFYETLHPIAVDLAGAPSLRRALAAARPQLRAVALAVAFALLRETFL